MIKKINYLKISVFVSLMFLLCAPSMKAVDICASKNLNNNDMAAQDCPNVCAKEDCCKKDRWAGAWTNFKAGMNCRTNGSGSVCGCINKTCCYECNQDGLYCTTDCFSSSKRYFLAGCLAQCKAAWNICLDLKCKGCPLKEQKEALSAAKKNAAPSIAK